MPCIPGRLPPRDVSADRDLVIRTAIPNREFLAARSFLYMSLLVGSGEYSLFTPADAFMCVQALEQKLRGGDNDFSLVLWFYSYRTQLFRKPLNVLDAIHQFTGRRGIAELELTTQIEPLRDLLHVPVFEVRIERTSDGKPNQITDDGVCS